MPRKGYNHGGRRQGAPGQAYSNRTDLNQNRQPVTVATGQPYGARQEQVAAQRAVPLPAAPPVPATPPGPAPGSFGRFDRPTERPDEPLTAGLPIGAGPGPEAVHAPAVVTQDDQILAQLRGLYATHPNSDLARLIDAAERRGGAIGGFGA